MRIIFFKLIPSHPRPPTRSSVKTRPRLPLQVNDSIIRISPALPAEFSARIYAPSGGGSGGERARIHPKISRLPSGFFPSFSGETFLSPGRGGTPAIPIFPRLSPPGQTGKTTPAPNSGSEREHGGGVAPGAANEEKSTRPGDEMRKVRGELPLLKAVPRETRKAPRARPDLLGSGEMSHARRGDTSALTVSIKK